MHFIESRSLFDYLSAGIQDIIAYKRGDRTRAKEYVVSPVTVESLNIDDSLDFSVDSFIDCLSNTYARFEQANTRDDITYDIRIKNNSITFVIRTSKLYHGKRPINEYVFEYHSDAVYMICYVDGDAVEETKFYTLDSLIEYLETEIEIFEDSTEDI